MNLGHVDLAQRMSSPGYEYQQGDEELAQVECEHSLAQISATKEWHTHFKVKEKSHKLDPKVL